MTDALDKDLDEILEAAAAWHVRLDLGTADEAAFEAWRDADPRHAAAFARMEGTDSAVKREKDLIPGEVDEFDVKIPQVNRRQWLSGALGAIGAGVIGLGASRRSSPIVPMLRRLLAAKLTGPYQMAGL